MTERKLNLTAPSGDFLIKCIYVKISPQQLLARVLYYYYAGAVDIRRR